MCKWHQTGDTSLSKPLMAYFTDAHVSLGLSELMLAHMNMYAADPKMIISKKNESM